MLQLENQAEWIQRMPLDLRVEVILADLIEHGISLDEVIVSPIGLFRRAYDRDIRQTETVESLVGKSRQLWIEINRDGIYDSLPEGLFHQPTSRRPDKTVKEIVDEFNIQKGREKAARRFFLPLEQEFYRQRVLLYFEERKHLLDADNVAQSDIFIRFWELPNLLEAQQVCNLLYLLPIAHRITGNALLTQLCLESILGQTVTIQSIPPRRYEKVGIPASVLGKTRLGVDFLTGEDFVDVIPASEVTIHLRTPEAITDYLPEGRMTKVLDFLYNYFMPIESDIVTRIALPEPQQGIHPGTFLLSDETHQSRLGYTTFLV